LVPEFKDFVFNSPTAKIAAELLIDYVGDWTSYSYRKAMQDAGYKNGDKLGGNMFP